MLRILALVALISGCVEANNDVTGTIVVFNQSDEPQIVILRIQLEEKRHEVTIESVESMKSLADQQVRTFHHSTPGSALLTVKIGNFTETRELQFGACSSLYISVKIQNQIPPTVGTGHVDGACR